jgi:hypothetical protein
MIAIERRGRLGNHLFQWAFGLAASRRLDTSFVMDHDSIAPLFDLDGHLRPDLRARNLLWLRSRGRRAPLVEVANEADPATVLAALEDGARYSGFFQSADYFAGHEDAVRRALAVKPEPRQRFRERYADLAAGGYVCVHLRRGDYADWKGGAALLPTEYVRRCIDLAAPAGRPVVVISDSIDEAEAELAGVPGVRFESNDPIVDLQLMIHASTCVVSNSTFAWWGAWLGDVPGRRVLAPRYWVGFREREEWPRRVVPGGWEQVDVLPGGAPV